MVTNRDVAVAFMHHGIVMVPKETLLTHEGPDGINTSRYWVYDHKPIIKSIGHWKWATIWRDVVLHGIEVPGHCVDFTEVTIIKTHWDNPVKNPVTIVFTNKMQRRFLANIMHIMGIGMRKFLKLFL